MDDAKIIELFWARDEQALAETEAVYGGKLRRFAEKILKNTEDAEECVSDTYLKAWETIPPQKPVYFFAYLVKICRHFAFGRLDWKSAAKRQADIVELTAEMEACIPGDCLEKKLESEEIGREINQFLASLPKESRVIFVRRYWCADSIQEISKRYRISESKVKTSLHRTRIKLRKYLEKEGILI